MNNLIKRSVAWTVSVISFAFTVVPETVFAKRLFANKFSHDANIVMNRLIMALIIYVVVLGINAIYLKCKKRVVIKGKNYQILVEYGDIFEYKDSKKVIAFDECFTTNVGDLPNQIKPTSICGQFLLKNDDIDIPALIEKVQLKPSKSKSDYNKNVRYESGRVLVCEDYLLMSFAKLDKYGLGKMSRNEYVKSLEVLWEEIDKYYGSKDVCIPIIGSGITRIDGSNASITQQELLDIIIGSYKLSVHKIKTPQKLHIVCKKQDDFSLNRIGEYL